MLHLVANMLVLPMPGLSVIPDLGILKCTSVEGWNWGGCGSHA